jgi:uncharacterized protein
VIKPAQKIDIRPILMVGVGILLLTAAVIWLAAAPVVQAQCVGVSSCKNCHELQGQRPSSLQYAWHSDHMVFDFCGACHSGDRLADEADAAHSGATAALDQMATYCRDCHVEDLEAYFGAYAEEAGIDAESALAQADAGPQTFSLFGETVKPAGPLLPGAEDGADQGGDFGAGAGAQPAPAEPESNRTANAALAGLLLAGVLGGGGYVVWNERRLVGAAQPGESWPAQAAGFLRQENWSPYAAGVLLGLTGIFAVAAGNRMLAASGPIATIASTLFNNLAPDAAQGNLYFHYVALPGLNWHVVLYIGIALGGLAGALSSGTFRLRWSDDPAWEKVFGGGLWKRLLLGFVGAMILQYGASIAGGCTSGLAISGGMVLAPAAFLFMGGMFASGILAAMIIYRRRY